MTRKFAELTFYPGEHSGAHEQNQVLTVSVSLDGVVDQLVESGEVVSYDNYRTLEDKLGDLEAELENTHELLRDAREDAEDLESEIDNKDTEIKSLQNIEDTLLQEIIDYRVKVRELKEWIAELERQVGNLDETGLS